MAGAKDLPSYAMVFLIVGIILVVAAYIVTSVYTQLGTADDTINQTVTNITGGLLNLASWMPIIAIVAAAAIILGLIIHSFGK